MSQEQYTPIPLKTAAKIVTYHLPPPSPQPIEEVQAKHRIRLLNSWAAIKPGARVLELGCGQGTCTAVLAEAVGDQGHVDAVDPAPADYGAPFTLGQAQAHLSKSAIGTRIAWHRDTPEGFLSRDAEAAAAEGGKPASSWDVAVLAHCIWYFPQTDVLASILRALRGRVARVCVAEYAMRASDAAAVPHLLAAMARGTLESHNDASEANIRTVLSPGEIRDIAAAAGWAVETQGELVPDEDLQDGYWETGTVASSRFLDEIGTVENERVEALLRSARDATRNAVDAVGGVRKVRTMDVWAAVLVQDGNSS